MKSSKENVDGNGADDDVVVDDDIDDVDDIDDCGFVGVADGDTLVGVVLFVMTRSRRCK